MAGELAAGTECVAEFDRAGLTARLASEVGEEAGVVQRSSTTAPAAKRHLSTRTPPAGATTH